MDVARKIRIKIESLVFVTVRHRRNVVWDIVSKQLYSSVSSVKIKITVNADILTRNLTPVALV